MRPLRRAAPAILPRTPDRTDPLDLVPWPAVRRPGGALVTEPSTPPSARTKEEIQAITVGDVVPLDGRIVLADPDPAWPALYAREEARIRAALGDRVLRIAHTGSTSVPVLAAKPI